VTGTCRPGGSDSLLTALELVPCRDGKRPSSSRVSCPARANVSPGFRPAKILGRHQGRRVAGGCQDRSGLRAPLAEP